MKNNEIALYKNGMIIKMKSNLSNHYLGVEGDNWFIDLDVNGVDKNELTYLYNYYCENIERSWEDDNYVDCCEDINYINRYVEVCKKSNIDFVIIFCETQDKFPMWKSNNHENIEDKLEFLGYDYAYAGGSFYSCIFNDVVSKRISELSSIQLNQYDLIRTEEEMANFIKLREKLKLTMSPYTFEEGNFIIYKLWRYVGDTPIVNNNNTEPPILGSRQRLDGSRGHKNR